MSATNCQLPAPPPFAIHDVGMPELWKEWRVHFMAYSTATKLNKEEAEVQVLTLLTIIGAEAHQVVFNFSVGKRSRSKKFGKSNCCVVSKYIYLSSAARAYTRTTRE